MSTLAREELVRRVQFMPKTPMGFLSPIGFALTIAGVVLVIAGDIGRGNAAGVTLVGVVLMSIAGYAIQRAFVSEARAAGFDDKQIRQIEDEAERLNEEED